MDPCVSSLDSRFIYARLIRDPRLDPENHVGFYRKMLFQSGPFSGLKHRV